MASVAGKRGLLAAGAYTATKHGLIGLTRTAALEAAGTGITVNAICPGATRTVMLLRRLQVDAELRGVPVDEIETGVNPIGRLLEPDEIAELAVYLASDDARGMTGQAVNLSGGSTMH
jgi:3-hydroxybutyrate dehydrogenase